MQNIEKLKTGLENAHRDLDAARAALAEKERIIKQRDVIMESNALESKRLADLVDKERQYHRNTKHQFETFQKTHQHTTRTLSQNESRVMELETARQQDRRKINTLENSFRDQMLERNQLLLTLWNRLSTLCGSDWTHNNSLINGRALPSLEAVATMLPGFSKNMLGAVKTIETLIGDFRTRIHSVEKDLWKEYQTLENNLEARTKRLDRLETMARSAVSGANEASIAELGQLKAMNKALKQELASLRTAHSVRSNTVDNPSPAPSIPTGPGRSMSMSKTRTSTLTRHKTTSAIETLERARSSGGSTAGDMTVGSAPENTLGSGSISFSSTDKRHLLRLQEMEFKLRAEREGRVLDRNSARQRLEEATREIAQLLAQVERSKIREEMGRSSGGAS